MGNFHRQMKIMHLIKYMVNVNIDSLFSLGLYGLDYNVCQQLHILTNSPHKKPYNSPTMEAFNLLITFDCVEVWRACVNSPCG